MIIGIVGIGIVGNAIYQSFLKKGINVIAYDKYKDYGTKLDDLIECDMIFLCLPTLFDTNIKSYDKTAIYETCEKLNDMNYSGLIIIKSTVEPETTEKLSKKYNMKFCHNPEFISAKTSIEDFDNQHHIIIGIPDQTKYESILELIKLYKNNYNGEISICKSTESELAKLTCNSFYAVKIQFFNEIYILSKKIGIEYEKIRELIIKNGWINPAHTLVPGTDSKLSYGGMCFPKDTNALNEYMKLNTVYNNVLEATIQERESIRDD